MLINVIMIIRKKYLFRKLKLEVSQISFKDQRVDSMQKEVQGVFFMNPKVNANNFHHYWNIFILLFATSSVKYAILPGIKNIILPCFLKTQSSFFQLLPFSPHKHDIKKKTE